MHKATQTKKLLIPAAVVLALILGWCWMGHSAGQVQTGGKSPFEAVLEGYTAYTKQEQYPAGVSQITISVENEGEVAHEFFHPDLERQQDGSWYSLQKAEEAATENLLYIEPGEAKDFTLWTQPYGSLPPGRYRAVFCLYGSLNYIAAEFDVI